MCEAHAYLATGSGHEAVTEKVMENVVRIAPDGDELVLTDLFGDEVRLHARIREIALLDNKIYLEATDPDRS
jgi:predicted RNA-binding protein